MFTGHRKLLYEYTNAGNIQMVRYLLSLPGICDVKMEDGTTAFVMSLARKDVELMKLLLNSAIKSELEPRDLVQRAVMALNRSPDERNANVMKVLTNALICLDVSLEEEAIPQQPISEE